LGTDRSIGSVFVIKCRKYTLFELLIGETGREAIMKERRTNGKDEQG
jgi:hypothetical protein